MDDVEQYPFDLALSYVTEDTSIADALINALERKGLNVFRDEIGSYFVSSRNFYIHSKDLLEKAHQEVILLSQPYLAQNYFEPPSSQINQLHQQKSRITLLRFSNTPIPQRLQFFTSFDLTPDDIEAAADDIERRRRASPIKARRDPIKVSQDPLPSAPIKTKTKEEWLKEGKARYDVEQCGEALVAFEKAIELDRDYAEAITWKYYALQCLENQKKSN